MNMVKAAEYIALFLLFPGFLFSVAMGCLVGWIDRKVTARVQWRVGPPWYQNFADMIKLLFYKETLMPEGVSKGIFLGMPLIAAASASLVSTMILVVNHAPGKGFIGDLIVIVYLLMIPPVATMLGAFASRNTLASLGASREMKMMLSYELPFILALIVPVMKSGYAIKLGDILLYQEMNGAIIGSVSGSLSFMVMIICIQAKLGLVPFDIPEAETEIMAGTFIEYSGKALGILKAARAILTFILPVIVMTLYMGGIKPGPGGFLKSISEYAAVVVMLVLIKNTNPRVRVDQALRFFWGPVTAISIVAVLAAYMGY
ncbi:MAG: complex I subunit 1 family protein [Candidatus Omnitrophota bacterium]